MLARTFLSAEELHITEEQKFWLVEVLLKLERDELREDSFNMSVWKTKTVDCNTVACIGGWTEVLAGKTLWADHNAIVSSSLPAPLVELFCARKTNLPLSYITTKHACKGLSNYLTTGKPDWSKVLGYG